MRGSPARRAFLGVLLLVLAVLAALASLGCAADTAPDLLNVVDVVPRAIDAGDRVEILGTNLPTGDAREASVVFEGELRRAGEPPVRGQRIEVEGAQLGGARVTLPFTEALQERFCGRGDDAVHTTFQGDVTVRVASVGPGALEVKGTVKGVTLDLIPPAPRRAVLEAREKEGARALAFLGITPSSDAPPAGGVGVAAVRPGSPAEAAQIAPGDVIVSFEGVQVLSASDVIPSGHERQPTIGILREGGRPTERPISAEGFKPSAPADLLGAGIILGMAAGIILFFMLPTARLVAWMERRVAARMARRAHAGRAGRAAPPGPLGGIAEGLRSMLEEDLSPGEGGAGGAGDRALVRLSPYLVFVGVSATFMVMPFGQRLIAADLDIGILFVIAVSSLVLIGLMTGGWASSRGWSLLGGLRAAAQILSYELPGALAIVCVVLMTGSLRLQDIIGAQAGSGGALFDVGGWPWYWFAFRSPVTFALFLLYFTAALAEGHRASFDLPEAEGDPSASGGGGGGGGGGGELAGMRALLFFFAEWANVFVMCGLAGVLFLGGWQIPGVAAAAQEASLGLTLVGALLFLAKSWGLILMVVWVRWALPRVRIDQMMGLCWKWFVPLSVGALLLTALWMVARVPPAVQLVISVVTFALWAFLVIHFVRRVQYNLRTAKVPLHLNPFL